MKFVEVPRFASVADNLRGHGRGDTRLHCRLELYASGKIVGQDKRTRREVERSMTAFDRAGIPAAASAAALGDLANTQHRKLLVDLVCTLNASFPDFDFVSVRPDSFVKASSTKAALGAVNQHFAEVGVDQGLVVEMWNAVNEELDLMDSEVYSHSSDADADPAVNAGTIWSFGYFIVDRSSSRIVYLACTAASRLARTPLGYRDAGSRVGDRASPESTGYPHAGTAAAAIAAAGGEGSSSSSAAAGAGAETLGPPPPVVYGSHAHSAGAVLAPASRPSGTSSSMFLAPASSAASTVATAGFLSAEDREAQAVFAAGLPRTPGGAPSAAALLFCEPGKWPAQGASLPDGDSAKGASAWRTVGTAGRAQGLAASGSDDADTDMEGDLERQRSTLADDDDDDDDMSGDGDGPRYRTDLGDDYEDGFGGSGPRPSQDGGGAMFDWEDVDT